MRYRERRIRSLKELKNVVGTLELDEGIRIFGKDNSFLFISKEEDHYTVSITNRVYKAKLRRYLPGKEESWLYPKNPQALWKIVLDKMERPVRAWVY